MMMGSGGTVARHGLEDYLLESVVGVDAFNLFG
jgi:hypothetical protein